ncbi:hypothetical protein LY78DRAFT_363859 [Colletotrichum sublineola]|nr:hypothetical protein LY78DRAFT_363859 [Colletotrichum sublineola]
MGWAESVPPLYWPPPARGYVPGYHLSHLVYARRAPRIWNEPQPLPDALGRG